MAVPSARTLQVVLGGINGYADLATGSNFADGIATGRLSLYTHGNGVIDEGGGGINAAIGRTWSATGPGVAEFGLYPSFFFPAAYPVLWTNNGLGVAEANVNVDVTDPHFLTRFKTFVDSGRTVGHIQNFAPVFSPNSTSQYNGSKASLGTGFFDPKWASVRNAAIYGGGIAFDTPPLFTALSPPWYFDFVAQEIRWANMMGLRTSVIVSPYTSGSDFLAGAQAFEQKLIDAHAIPSQWVIESYEQKADGSYPNAPVFPNPVGSERTPNTEANVADWFARNAPVAVLSPTGGSWRIQNADGSFGDTVTGSLNGTSLTQVSATGTTFVTYAADGAQTGSRFAVKLPKLAHQTPNQSVQGGKPLAVTLASDVFVDPAGRALTYAAHRSDMTALPSWLSFDPVARVFTGTPPNAAARVSVRVDATTSDGRSSAEVFSISVRPVRLSLSHPAPDAAVQAGAAFSFGLPASSFIDTGGASIAYSARQADFSALPGWLRFDPASGAFSGTAPDAATSLAVRVDAAATDGLVASETFRLAVQPARPAFIGAAPPGQGSGLLLGQSRAFAVAVDAGPVAADVLRTARQADLSALPSWVSFDAATGVLSGTTPASHGSLTVRADETPASGAATTHMFKLVF